MVSIGDMLCRATLLRWRVEFDEVAEGECAVFLVSKTAAFLPHTLRPTERFDGETFEDATQKAWAFLEKEGYYGSPAGKINLRVCDGR